MIRSFLISVFILLCFALLESAVLSNIRLLPAVPDFLLACTVYLAVQNGRAFGSAAGFFSGLSLDFLSASPLGLHCLLRTVLGYSFGFFSGTLNVQGFILPAFVGLCATLYKTAVLFVISLLFPQAVRVYSLLSVAFISELAMNTLLTPVVFRFLDIFRRHTALPAERA